MKLRLFITTGLLLSTLWLFSQNQEDALRFSKTSMTGTARYMATGGAFGAIGADFSAIGVNPAGIGMFRKSEFVLTPLINFRKTEVSYFDEIHSDDKYNLGLGNIGFIYSSGGSNRIQFGFGYNRINNFNNRAYIKGYNDNSSLLSNYVHLADNKLPEYLDPFSTQLAYDSWLIWEDTNLFYNNDAYWGHVMQEEKIITEGSMRELQFSFGSDYNDVFYFGAAIGIPMIRYNYESVFSETDPQNKYPEFISMKRREIIETRGTGVNLKLGAIGRVGDWLRLGVAFHTPTYYSNMEDKWRVSMDSELFIDNEIIKKSAESPRGRFKYELTTPMKAIGSASLLLGKSGFISAEYEFADYTEAKLNSSDYKFESENKNIRDSYTAAHNLRFGTEWRISDIYFRGGYALLGSPYKSGINTGKSTQTSLGLGFRQHDYYIDFAWVNTKMKENRYMYSVPSDPELEFFTPVAKQNFSEQMYMLTLGWRF